MATNTPLTRAEVDEIALIIANIIVGFAFVNCVRDNTAEDFLLTFEVTTSLKRANCQCVHHPQ